MPVPTTAGTKRGLTLASLAGHGFLYYNVAAELRRRIVDGVYPPGRAIPSEAMLVKAFGVSAITVRRALRELMFEGVLYGRQGLGVFVADTRRIARVLSGPFARSLGDEIRRAGLTPGIREIAYTRLIADEELAARLGVRRGTEIVRHEKLVLADQAPISIDTVHMPKRLAESLREKLREEFVFPLLTASGIRVARTDFRFESVPATERDAVLLGLTPRFPLIVARYVLIDGRGKPLLDGYTVSRSDRVVFDLSAWPSRAAAIEHSKRSDSLKRSAHGRKARLRDQRS